MLTEPGASLLLNFIALILFRLTIRFMWDRDTWPFKVTYGSGFICPLDVSVLFWFCFCCLFFFCVLFIVIFCCFFTLCFCFCFFYWLVTMRDYLVNLVVISRRHCHSLVRPPTPFVTEIWWKNLLGKEATGPCYPCRYDNYRAMWSISNFAFVIWVLLQYRFCCTFY